MAAVGEVFVTPHAVQRFQEHCAPGLDRSHALAAIIDALRADVVGGVRVLRAPGDERAALQVRVSGRYCFRAVIKAPEPGRTLPVVVTIKPSGRRRRAVVPSWNPEVRDGRD